jgi:hypothetical protein
MKYTCPNGHGSSDIYPICHNCEAKMNTADTSKAPKAAEPVIVEEATKEEEIKEHKKKR